METTTSELNKLGKKFLGKKFIGVYPSDKIPISIRNGEMFIFNLDKSDKPGSHWCAIAKEKGKMYFYDSFGRNPYTLLQNIQEGLYFDREDREQSDDEENCGQRSIAFLMTGKKFGFKNIIDII